MTQPQPADAQPRPRGRRPTFDRERALDVALELFWRCGYDGVGIADLTAAIGIAPPSLYHAFGSKAGLFREVLKRYGHVGLSPDEIAAQPSARVAARALLERGVAAVTAPGRPLGCMVSSGLLMTSPENGDLAQAVRAMRDGQRGALEQCIRRDMGKGVLPADVDPVALARFTSAVLQGLSVQALDGASSEELLAVTAVALKRWPNETPKRGC